MGGMAVGWRDEYVVIIFQFFLNINSVPLHEMELHKMTKDLALRPQYAQYPNPNPKPELFGQTQPEPHPKSKSRTRHGLFLRQIHFLLHYGQRVQCNLSGFIELSRETIQ